MGSMTPELLLIAAGVAGYLLGSIPFGLVITRMLGLGDIRAIGSGNIGATNVLRTGNKGAALATLILDSGKGAIAALIARYVLAATMSHDLGVEAGIIAGACAVLGHNFPVWLGFKGGKGVATTLGTLLATAPYVGLAACGIWLLTAVVTRYSSLAALVSLTAAPVLAWFLATPAHAAAFALLAALAWIRHRENLRRLLNGSESRIGDKKKKA
ncbi:glycerol-3-phosphate 1-O-acyltransferase PlsY [Caenispirillum salinarum]|nr:glycerol-3-phosphate 1-O-acyltransferase PlsY [Caenispirillum salinarum]